MSKSIKIGKLTLNKERSKFESGEKLFLTKYFSVNLFNYINYVRRRNRLLIINLIVVFILSSLIIGFCVQFAPSLSMNRHTEWGHEIRPLPTYNLITLFSLAFTRQGFNFLPIYLILVSAFFAFFWLKRMKDIKNIDNDGFETSESGIYGTAKWMLRKTITEVFRVSSVDETDEPILGTKDSYIISMPMRSLYENDLKSRRYNGHVGIIGSSGSGKTRSYVLPNILQAIRRGDSLFITDPKGEIKRSTYLYAKAAGYVVKTIDLVNPNGSDSINFLQEVFAGADREADFEDQMHHVSLNLATFIDILMKNTKDPRAKSDEFWENNERNLAEALCLYVLVEPKYNDPATGRKGSLGDVYDILVTYNLAPDLRENPLASTNPLNINKNHPSYTAWSSFEQSATNVKQGIQNGLRTRLGLLKSDDIKNVVSEEDIDLALPAQEKCIYYLVLSDTNQAYSFISSMFFSFAFMRLQLYADNNHENDGYTDVPVHMLMDEFPNIGVIPDFAQKISVFRSRGVFLTAIVQTHAQLTKMFPLNESETVIGNMGVLIVLGVNDNSTAKYISEALGNATIDNVSESRQREMMDVARNRSSYRESETRGKRLLMNPDEVRRMPLDTLLVISNGNDPLKLKKFDYTDHPDSKNLKDYDNTTYVPKWRQKRNEKRIKKKTEKLMDNQEFTSEMMDEITKEAKRRLVEKERTIPVGNELPNDSLTANAFSGAPMENNSTVAVEPIRTESPVDNFYEEDNSSDFLVEMNEMNYHLDDVFDLPTAEDDDW